MREIGVRVDVLRNNVKVTELDIISAPSLKADASSEIKVSMSGEFAPNDIIDWLQDELNPVITINGTDYPLGIYAPTTYEAFFSGSEKAVRVEAYDRCWRLKATTTAGIVHFDEGSSYIDAITSLLTQAGLSLVNITPSDLTFSTDREDWEIGTDYLTIVNELLNEMSYNPIWFNSYGYAVLNKKAELSGNPVRKYSFSDIKSLCIDANISVDLFNAPNSFICICSNPDKGAPWVAAAEITNPISPLSIIRRGRKLTQVYKVNNIASLTELQNYANMLAYQNSLIGEQITITTGLIPGCGINEVVSIIHPSASGLCRETGWSMNLEVGGTMTHELESVALNIPKEDEEIVIIGTIAGIAIAGVNVVGVTGNETV